MLFICFETCLFTPELGVVVTLGLFYSCSGVKCFLMLLLFLNKIFFINVTPSPKKGFHLESVSDFSIFMTKAWCSLKKKEKKKEKRSLLRISLKFFNFYENHGVPPPKKGLHLESVSVFQLQCSKNSSWYGNPIMQ